MCLQALTIQNRNPREWERSYRHTGEVTFCSYGTCDRAIDLEADADERGGAYVKGIGWCCSGHVLACSDRPEDMEGA